jgi:hypothetical protein
MCGLPLHRQPGLERDFPHSRGFDCPRGHASATDPEVWEAARKRTYLDELQDFLEPVDRVACAEHLWSLVEVDDSMLILQCARCGSLSTTTVDALG